MDILVSVSQALLYVCFAILMGTFVMKLIPGTLKPQIQVPANLLMWCASLVPVLAFVPVLSITLFISPRLGFFKSLQLILTTYTVGTAWTFTFLLSSILLFILFAIKRQNEEHGKLASVFGVLLVIGIIGTIAWSSHASSESFALGIISDFLHLLSVSIWVGILLIVGWFSRNTENWVKYLTWFSVVAITCLGATAISGFLMLDVLVDDYVDSWMISYGQGLFLKHIFLIPLVFYAAFNGLFVKFKMGRDEGYNPLRGVRAESVILLVIFVLTAFFSQASPPSGHFLTEDAISPLFKLFHDGAITATSTLQFTGNPIAIAFIFGSAVILGLNIFALFRKTPIWLLFTISALFVVSFYMTFMILVQVS